MIIITQLIQKNFVMMHTLFFNAIPFKQWPIRFAKYACMIKWDMNTP